MDASRNDKPSAQLHDLNQAFKKQKLMQPSDMAYDADVDDECSENKHALNVPIRSPYNLLEAEKIQSERSHIYEFFQPWALKTYGDQAKTKTITMRKKARILKALEGKEHSRPDSSKFRFWVKSKGFTTKRPEGFVENPSSHRSNNTLPPDAILSDNPSRVDLFVASRTKENGKRLFRKVAVVEEFFDIIYNVHMELGGRSGMHAGQKRTYRIITETYAFLPREAVTRFLSTCPECKKNLRPSSPGASSHHAEQPNESSSEVEVLNYSSHTESSLEAGPTLKNNHKSQSNPILTTTTTTPLTIPTTTLSKIAISSQDNNFSQKLPTSTPKRHISFLPHISHSLHHQTDTATLPASVSDAIVGPSCSQEPSCPNDNNFLRSQEHLLRYYEFVRRFYATGISVPETQISPTSQASTSKYCSSKIPLPVPSNPSSQHTVAKSYLRRLSDDEDVDSSSPVAKKFKSSAHLQANYNYLASRAKHTSATQCSVLNLSKQLSYRSEVLASDVDVVAAPCLEFHKEIKQEPQLKEDDNSRKNCLPPLDLESLKPITSTYLQLTRSMGLSDEDALRFDNLVSDDFKYSL